MSRVVDETGSRFGRLRVMRRNPKNAYHAGATWICQCDCGNTCVAAGIALRQGMVKSCGCAWRERRWPTCKCGYRGTKTKNWTPDWQCNRCSKMNGPMKLWTCDKCKTVVRDDTGAPQGWVLNLFAGVSPICPDCQPAITKAEQKLEKVTRNHG